MTSPPSRSLTIATSKLGLDDAEKRTIEAFCSRFSNVGQLREAFEKDDASKEHELLSKLHDLIQIPDELAQIREDALQEIIVADRMKYRQ